MRLSPRLLLALVLFSATACTDPLAEAQKANTIEGYESFLKDNPNHPQRIIAESMLEELFLTKARDTRALEDYDAYLERFPKGKLRDKALEERREFLFAWAAETNTAESWQTFLDEYPKGNKKQLQEARRRKNMAENLSRVGISPVEVEQVNLAENPDGPLDGWGFRADIENKGDTPIEHLMFEVQYLGSDGKRLSGELWPVVAKALPGNLPKPEGFADPIPPGQSRTFEYTTGDLPAGWSKKVKLVPTDIRLVK
jgi:hypothetical protein